MLVHSTQAWVWVGLRVSPARQPHALRLIPVSVGVVEVVEPTAREDGAPDHDHIVAIPLDRVRQRPEPVLRVLDEEDVLVPATFETRDATRA